MPNFTLQLKTVIELGGRQRYKAIGLDDYPIFDESYRETLNEKIIRAYLNEEIAHESIAIFRNEMRSRMELEMPYFNGLYESERIKYDPLMAIDLKTINDTTQDTNSEANATSISTNTGSATNEARNYSYPQQQLRSDGEYMTSAAQSDSENESESNSNDTSRSKATVKNTGDTTMQGRQQSAQSLINEFRGTLLNIDSQVVDMLSDLFMGVWTTGQAFTNYNNYFVGSIYSPYYRGF